MSKRPPKKMIWSAAQVTAEIEKHRNDDDWIPGLVKSGGYVIQDRAGNFIPPPKEE